MSDIEEWEPDGTEDTDIEFGDVDPDDAIDAEDELLEELQAAGIDDPAVFES